MSGDLAANRYDETYRVQRRETLKQWEEEDQYPLLMTIQKKLCIMNTILTPEEKAFLKKNSIENEDNGNDTNFPAGEIHPMTYQEKLRKANLIEKLRKANAILTPEERAFKDYFFENRNPENDKDFPAGKIQVITRAMWKIATTKPASLFSTFISWVTGNNEKQNLLNKKLCDKANIAKRQLERADVYPWEEPAVRGLA